MHGRFDILRVCYSKYYSNNAAISTRDCIVMDENMKIQNACVDVALSFDLSMIKTSERSQRHPA